MAIMKQAWQAMIEKLDDQYRFARESMFVRGEDTAQNIQEMDVEYQRKADELRRSYDMNDVYGQQILDPRTLVGTTAIGNGGGNYGAIAAQNQISNNVGQMLQNTGMGTSVKPAEEKEGVLFFRGGELPEVWMGAHYNSYQRAVVGRQWKISYSSPFSSDTIMLWLSSEQFSGQEADKVARTYLETINQRRLG